MNASNDGMLLHLAFDEIEAGRIEDLTDNDNDGLIEGAPQLVPDSKFGSCLSFNENASVSGSHVLVQDVGLVGPNPAHTIEAWIRFRGLLPGRQWLLVLGQAGGGAHHWLLKADGTTQLGVWDGTQAGPRVPIDEWVHIAMAFDGRLLTCYLNGAVQGQPQAAQFNFTGKDLVLAKSLAGEYDFRGKIAGVRVYNRALTADEVKRDMADDQTAAAAFRQVSPIDFDLLDEDDNPVLYIEDDLAAHSMKFEISNTSRKDLNLIKPSAGVASPANNHFELKFRPGTLSSESSKKIAVAESNWNLLKSLQPDGSLSLYFLAAAGGLVKSGDKLKLTLQNVSASADAGARGTRVELKYQQLQYPDTTAPISGNRLEHLSIVNQSGKKNIPLHVGFAGPNTVLNDGQSGSDLILRITNTLKDKSLALTPGKTKFILSFDVEQDWALGTTSQVEAIGIDNPGWTIVPARQGITPQWTLTHATKNSLAPGEAISISLKGIKTSKPAGQTNLYLRYENFPGYWDGQFVCIVEKSPMMIAGRNVGIGVANPAAPLHVKGEARVEGAKLEVVRESGLAIRVDPSAGKSVYVGRFEGNSLEFDYAWGQALNSTASLSFNIDSDNDNTDRYIDFRANGMGFAGGSSLMRILENGNVGIGTTASPEAKFQIIHANQDANGNAFIIGPTNQSNLRLGYHAEYSWVQSHGSKPLAINPLGNNVGIGTSNAPERLTVDGTVKATGLSINSGYQFKKIIGGHFQCGPHNGGVKEVRIDFPEPFAVTPQAIVTPRSEGYYEDTFAVTVKYIERTHFKVNIMRLDAMKGGWAQNLRLDWIAWSLQ